MCAKRVPVPSALSLLPAQSTLPTHSNSLTILRMEQQLYPFGLAASGCAGIVWPIELMDDHGV